MRTYDILFNDIWADMVTKDTKCPDIDSSGEDAIIIFRRLANTSNKVIDKNIHIWSERPFGDYI